MNQIDKLARENFITGKLRAYLDRKTAPRGIADKPTAMREELAALVRCVLRYAPRQRWEEWWPQFEDRLSEDATTRAWPSEGEVKKAAGSLRGIVSVKPADGDETDAVAVAGKRMAANEAVGDEFMYGRRAVELLRRGFVDLVTMRRYRSGLYFSAKNVYGEATARKMEAEWIARHEAAEKLDDLHQQRRDAKTPEPKRMVAHEWDGE